MKANIIQVFEHDVLRVGDVLNGVAFQERHRKALESLAGIKGSSFYSLINRGVKFNEHVGVIAIGRLVIEILPKADRKSNDHKLWQKVLIQMLKEAGHLKVNSLSEASLSLKSNYILDLYIEIFIQELEYLIHSGLVKKYRQVEGNVKALKGSLQFAKHISNNITHQERFYVRHQVYDTNHLIHKILSKVIELLPSITFNASLLSRVRNLQIAFPELPTLKVTEGTFSNLKFDRKTEHYKQAIEIAKLLLLNYHPDVINGSQSVLAILFDMNELWEKYICSQLLKHSAQSTAKIKLQYSTKFWENKTVRPDIVVETSSGQIVLDTKWKLPQNGRPSDEDLKQVFVYNQYYGCANTFLLYPYIPGSQSLKGIFHKDSSICHLYFITIISDNALSRTVAKEIFEIIKLQ